DDSDMLKRFTVRNYKNFRNEITIDFSNIAAYQFSTDCICDGLITKMLIYGRNATGKTNLGKALTDIRYTMFYVPGFIRDNAFLNADSKEESAVFSYEFDFDGQKLVYEYARFSYLELHWEKLFIDDIKIFECDFTLQKYDFDNL